MAIPNSFLQDLIARADIVDVVGRSVQLKKGGANLMGLCPFHGEKSPSFSVSPTKQFYHCFGCGKNGNVISFLMEHAGMTFVEAVEDLAKEYGMQVPQDDVSPQDRAREQAQRERQNTLTSVLQQASDAYRKHLKDAPRAVAYLKNRGLSGEVAKRYGLGYAPDGWRSLASVFAHYDDALLVDSGLVISNTGDEGGEAKRYDRFRDRIMFPIRNIKGECIGFGGRVLGDEKPKYLNSPETPVFSKGRELYGLFEARSTLREFGYVLVTEGYMDVVALAQLGFPNCVATLGTACTPDHVMKLFRFTDAVVFGFDGDAAGRRAARKALDVSLPFASDVRSIKFLFLPPEHDPDSFIRAHGAEAFAKYVADAVPLSRFLVESAGEACDLLTAEGRAHLASNAKSMWMQLPEGALKLQLLAEIAEQVQLSAAELSALWMPASGGARTNGATRGGHAAGRFGAGGSYAQDRNSFGSGSVRMRAGARLAPASRADHAVRILLGNSALWDRLTHEDHSLLCGLPEPHGPLLSWLDSQLHEHGPLLWDALQSELQGHALQAAAVRLMAEGPVTGAEGHESAQELRDLLNRMVIDQLKVQETEAIAAANTDPQALQRYRTLRDRRLQLVKAQSEGIIQG
jgi:DNA primase